MTHRRREWRFGFEPPFFWWWGTGPRTRGRRRRRQWFESGDMKYVILRTLAEKPMHGYEVMKALEEQTYGCYKPSPGTVYPTLQWLEDEGLVQSEEREGKKVYSITDSGKEFLDKNKSTVEEIFDRVDEMIDHLVTEPMPELNRTVAKLLKLAYKSSWRYRDDEAKRRKVNEILERAVTDLEATLAQGES